MAHNEEIKEQIPEEEQIPEDQIDKLFENVMKNNWSAVVAAYRKCRGARVAKLTKSEDTALHIAVSNDLTRVALDLIHELDEHTLTGLKNASRNNPLHLAAMFGNMKLCVKMAEKSTKLITARNSCGETPIFLAALHGKDDVFFYLHEKIGVVSEECLRRKNGDTVLHVVVSGEYFGMAMKIIDDHQDLIDAKNEDGLSPLHVLANNPNAFKSSTRLGIFDRLIYYCVAVVDEEIKVKILEKTKTDEYRRQSDGSKGKDHGNVENYPKNYKTCMDFVTLLKFSFEVLVIRILEIKKCMEFLRSKFQRARAPHCTNRKGKLADKENQKIQSSSSNQQGSRNAAEETSWKDVPLIEEDTIKRFPAANITSSSRSSGSEKEEKQYNGNEKHLFPPNYATQVLFFKFILKVFLIILGVGIWRIQEIQRKKQLHIHANIVLEKMVELTKSYKSYGNTGFDPGDSRSKVMEEAGFISSMIPDKRSMEDTNNQLREGNSQAERKARDESRGHKGKMGGKRKGKSSKKGKEQTPMLIAAKTGATEMVEMILDKCPVAIQDVDAEHKNVVLLAIENRQPHVYKFLLKRDNIQTESVFRHVDHRGNSALHLAATQCGEYRPWLIPGSALQMQWEFKWFEFVKSSMPPNFFPIYNKKRQTPTQVFAVTHRDLIKDGSEWLTKTSESCSVVAALVATVAFATSATVPGGINEDKGTPTLEEKPAFNAFAVSSLAALCFSVTALVFFLSILTSRYQEKDFALDLPRKLLLGLTSLFAAIISMLVSFCSGHIFVLNHQLRYVAYPLYAALCFPITFFAFAQLSLYFDLVLSIFKTVPQRSYEVLAH